MKAEEKFGSGYLSRAVDNQLVTIGRLMVGRTFPGAVAGMRVRPGYSSIMVTQNCNYKCVMCSFWHRQTNGELTTEEIARATRELRQIGIQQVNFTGGEPFLRSDLAEIVRSAADNDFVMVQVTTNGSLSTKERLAEVCANGLGRVAISCDGIGEHHEKQRGVPGAWKKNIATLDALRDLRATKYPKLEIELAMVLSKTTAGDLSEILKLCDEYRAVMHVQFLDNVQFFTTDADFSDNVLSPEEIDRIVDEIHHHLDTSKGMDPLLTHEGIEYVRRYMKREDPTKDMPRPSCGVGYAMLYIDSLGNVFPGCFAMAPIGNLREKPLAAIVDSKRHRAVAEDMFRMNCPHCPGGYAWGVFTNPRALGREVKGRAVRRLKVFGGSR